MSLISHSKEGNVGYIQFRESSKGCVKRVQEVPVERGGQYVYGSPEFIIDYDENGNVHGIEIMYWDQFMNALKLAEKKPDEKINCLDGIEKKIPEAEVNSWMTEYTTKFAKNETTERLGQSFCNKFQIQNSYLFYCENDTEATKIITKRYMV